VRGAGHPLWAALRVGLAVEAPAVFIDLYVALDAPDFEAPLYGSSNEPKDLRTGDMTCQLGAGARAWADDRAPRL
jgi:hypothetical protein